MGAIYNKITGKVEIVSDAQKEFFKQGAEQIKALYRKALRPSLGESVAYNLNPAYIPNLEDVSRRFIKRTDDVLVDEVAGRNVTPLYPVSSFDGVNGKVNMGTLFNNSPISYFKCRFYYETTEIGWGSICGYESYDLGQGWFVYTTGDNLKIHSRMDTGGLVVIPILPKTLYTLELNITNDTINIDLNGSTYSMALGVGEYPNTFLLGARHHNSNDLLFTDTFDGLIWDVIVGNISIPLPHLGYGFDANGNKVDLTVSGGVTEDYDENGSSHLIDNGVVERYPELYYNIKSLTLDPLTEGGYTEYLEEGQTYYIPTPNINIKVNFGPIWESWASDGLYTCPSGFSSVRFRNFGDTQITFNPTIKNINPTILPNNNSGQPIDTLQEGDVFIAGSNFINKTDFMVDMSRPNGAESENFSEFTTLEAGWTKDGDTYSYDGTGVSASGVEVDAILTAGEKYIVNAYGEGGTISDCPIWSNISFSDDLGYRKVQNGYSTRIYNAISSKLRLAQLNNPICSVKGISVKLATPEILFFDKSDASIWKDAVTGSIYYNSNNPFEWHSSELTQEFIEDNVQPDALNKFWSKDYKDLFLYINALTAEQQVPANKYTS